MSTRSNGSELAEKAAATLAELGYDNVHVLHGDGTRGWPAHAPYDAIVVAAGGIQGSGGSWPATAARTWAKAARARVYLLPAPFWRTTQPSPAMPEPRISTSVDKDCEGGGNGFLSVSATHAALLLAQGAGRLIRTTSDKGVVAVLDGRLSTARYAEPLLAALPPVPRL